MIEPGAAGGAAGEAASAQESAQRANVCALARSWVRTPYRHAARVKGHGADCATLLMEVYHEAGLIPRIEPEHYPPDWHLHQGTERYLGWVEKYAREVEAAQPGDVVLYRWGRAYAHGAIVIDPGWPTIVHAMIDARFVIFGRGADGRLAARPHKFFTLW